MGCFQDDEYEYAVLFLSDEGCGRFKPMGCFQGDGYEHDVLFLPVEERGRFKRLGCVQDDGYELYVFRLPVREREQFTPMSVFPMCWIWFLNAPQEIDVYTPALQYN